MAALTGLYISQSYGGVIHLSTNTGIVPGTYTELQDGFGTNLGVRLNGQGAISASSDASTNGITIGRGTGNFLENTVIGSNAFENNTTGIYHTVMGRYALQSNTTGIGNVAIGGQALYVVTTGSYNTAIGFNTGIGIITGTRNTIVGANVTGLSASLDSNIILANGSGAIKGQHDGTNWSFQGTVTAPTFIGALTGNASTATTASFALNAGASINTGSFATTGSNIFVGNQTISGSVKNKINALSISSLTASIDLSTGNLFTLTLVNGVNTHISASNIQLGQTAQLQITQPGAGIGTATFNSAFSFPSGSSYSAFASASAVDVISFTAFSSTKLRAVSQNNFI